MKREHIPWLPPFGRCGRSPEHVGETGTLCEPPHLPCKTTRRRSHMSQHAARPVCSSTCAGLEVGCHCAYRRRCTRALRWGMPRLGPSAIAQNGPAANAAWNHIYNALVYTGHAGDGRLGTGSPVEAPQAASTSCPPSETGCQWLSQYKKDDMLLEIDRRLALPHADQTHRICATGRWQLGGLAADGGRGRWHWPCRIRAGL